ncbi:hypothetical protein LRS73_35505 (plasmid) [Methylobacterium currus]|uniref:hypothetical protein n=1 Tax=Methylobacterium currus TaxID=2051553 RepID=UPI001E4E6ADA|nr:hypothetical protein [Methylobacterium currus]UHC20485.1 hypothetical protein LRS73_35505 [Methylobacterium currus]
MMHPRMKDRLSRLEAQRITRSHQPPAGMIPVLMFAIASRLGGYPQPQDLDPSRSVDGVCDGLARGLGYGGWAEMDQATQDESGIEAWGARMETAFTELLRTEGIDRSQADDVEVFGGLVRILDEAGSREPGRSLLTGRPITGWGDIDARLDEWIRASGLSPERVRAAARA